VLRHHPALRAMRDAIHGGRFGRPVQLVAVCGQHFPTYRPAYREIYYTDRATGGGAVQDALTHTMNAGQWLAGPIDRVAADVAHQVLDGVDVEDTAHVLARHGEVLASYSLNQYQAPNEFTMTVVCERGTCRFQLHKHCWAWVQRPDAPWHEEGISGLQRDDLFIAQANAFLNLLDGSAEPTCSLAEAVQTLRTNLAVLASADEGTWKETDAR
jgi:predicted dehydrogenase